MTIYLFQPIDIKPKNNDDTFPYLYLTQYKTCYNPKKINLKPNLTHLPTQSPYLCLMFTLSKEALEFSTPLSADTLGIDGVWMWLVLEIEVVLFTKTYNNQSLMQAPLIIHCESLVIEEVDQKVFSLGEVTKCKQVLAMNKANIKRYTLGELGVEELIRDFNKFV